MLISVLLLVLSVLPAAAFAEEGGQAGDDGGGEPDDTDTGGDPNGNGGEDGREEPTEAPAAPVVTQEPTQAPTEAPTEAPTPETTPAPTEEPGSVNLNMYVFTTSDAPAAGYSVNIDGAAAQTNAQGLAQFAELSVGDHRVRITSPDGLECTGRIYMSRGPSTVVTDQAMGGTYGLSIASGQHEVYMVVTFEPDEALLIRTVSNVVPALPEQAAAAEEPITESDIEYPAKTVTTTWLTQDGTGLSGLRLSVEGGGLSDTISVDSRGQAVLHNVPYGSYAVTALLNDSPVAQFTLTMNPAQTTAILANSPPEFIVNSSVHAQRLFLEFRQAGETLVLTGASDSPIGGMNSLLIGVLVIAAIAAAAIVLIVIARRRKKTRTAARMRPTAVRPSAPGPEEHDSLYEAEQSGVKRTGGANKFNVDASSYDDRSRM